MYQVIKRVKKRRYRYLQRSYRVGKKVCTESWYLGPVDGQRDHAAMYTDPDKIAANAKALSEGRPVDGNGTPVASSEPSQPDAQSPDGDGGSAS